MLSQSMEKTIAVLRTAQQDGEPMSIEHVGAMLRVICQWQAIAEGLERRTAPVAARGKANWQPKIVGGTAHNEAGFDTAETGALSHVQP